MNFKKYLSTLSVSLLFLFTLSCSSFIKGNDLGWLNVYEGENSRSHVYRLVKDIDINGKVLTRGTSVRVIIVTDSDWLKVYAYRAAGNPLRDDRFLALYLFQSDFPNGKFERAYFQKEFSKVFVKK